MTWWDAVATRLRFGGRSNGVRLSGAALARVRAGNAARTRQDWRAAAAAYRAALALDRKVAHLWVQLGHMEKEAGAINRAAAAYHEAARLRPDDVEPLLHLGHMTKAWGEPMDAAGHFVTALERDAGNGEAMAELVRLLPGRDGVDPAMWSAILDVLGIDPAEQVADERPLAPKALLFDITDLIAFFGQRRLPTGIQRVQIEVTLACLEGAAEVRPVFCLYACARRGWIVLAPDLIEDVCRLAKQGDDVDDPAWKAQLDRLYRRVAVARTVAFSRDAMLVNLGTSWADRNYLLDVRIVRRSYAVVYIALIFDLIPLIGPKWFTESLVRDYRAWLDSLLHSADGCLAISQATRSDLLRAAREGAVLPDATVSVIRLDGNFRQETAPFAAVSAHGLEPGRYVLFVSTLEPRKNHRGAFLAWLALEKSMGEAAMPRLVCVGGRGWLNEELYALLRQYPVLRRMVLILHGVPDDELAALYEHCLFALYPSFYEGWGLPVSEALSYGKVPAISRTSSLPEVGGAFAHYFDPHDVSDIAATVRSLLDHDVRIATEAVIRHAYRPRSWHEIARDMVAQASKGASRSTQTLPCLAGGGLWTLALSRDAVVVEGAAPAALQGEALRHGRAWQAPAVDGCRIRGDDAALWFHWAGLPGATFHIRFAANERAADVRIGLPGGDQNCRLGTGEPAILSCPLPFAPATLWIPIVPLMGNVTVESVFITLAA